MDLTLVIGIAEIVGGIAIVGSLIYVGLQVDQNTRATRAGTHQGLIEQMRGDSTLLITDPGLHALVRKGEADPDALTDEERARFYEFAALRMTTYEAVYYNNLKGLLDTDIFEAWDGYFRAMGKTPGYVAYYRDNPEGTVAPFARYFESLIED